MSFFSGDYTEEEQRGIDKYLWRRFVFGMIGMGIMLLLMLTGYSCSCISDACTRAEYIGTWVLSEDYNDGFDSDDRYIELCYEENRRGEEILRLYMDGTSKGEVIRKDGYRAVETRDFFNNLGIGLDVTIRIHEKKGQITLKYKDYSDIETTSTINSIIGDAFNFSYSVPDISAIEVTETYIRISKKAALTEEQRAALY